MGVCRIGRPPRGVGVLASRVVRVKITGRVESVSEIPLGAGVL
jgi:hypothetical protein